MSKGADTRTTILDRGLAAASRLGLEGLSIGQLADDVGMSKSGLFAHFGSKEDLQLRVLEHGVERFVAQVMAPAFRRPRGEPRIRALFDNWLQWVHGDAVPGGCVFIAAANEYDDRPGALRDRVSQYQSDWMQALATAARLAVEAGHFRSDLDCDQFAHEFYAIILAHQHFSRLMQDPGADARAAAAFERLLADARVA